MSTSRINSPLPSTGSLLLLLLLCGWMQGCAPASQTQGRVPAPNRDRLELEEIRSVAASDLYEVVARLRPQWLRNTQRRSFGLSTEVVVYQNQTFLGGPEALRRFGVESAYALRYLDGTTASNTLPGIGSRHVAGAIVVITIPD